ncbi:hypothetical protein TREMEDRAFT_64197 [Tremella mesenterica DSM 1558]|uniref:uncharacterized protein n=1 Tax=Tremella mesenterica (strain ATCC 24925 / CBS 8224 / DSM 1558 / NBRC 9311 / NRRL Y-6157 / RJB 2259-6 / UBC 559-6) TaxID=578456 RepID=UPI0003F49AE5|nr:uncharacterized protein TREMEDRAFT_64197 [Tremella mesenterica DSM 1558]EIW67605.1 hypothetical protein TREMEDRAFT_64197 [Tremella mesenterica DSM 1558]
MTEMEIDNDRLVDAQTFKSIITDLIESLTDLSYSILYPVIPKDLHHHPLLHALDQATNSLNNEEFDHSRKGYNWSGFSEAIRKTRETILDMQGDSADEWKEKLKEFENEVLIRVDSFPEKVDWEGLTELTQLALQVDDLVRNSGIDTEDDFTTHLEELIGPIIQREPREPLNGPLHRPTEQTAELREKLAEQLTTEVDGFLLQENEETVKFSPIDEFYSEDQPEEMYSDQEGDDQTWWERPTQLSLNPESSTGKGKEVEMGKGMVYKMIDRANSLRTLSNTSEQPSQPVKTKRPRDPDDTKTRKPSASRHSRLSRQKSKPKESTEPAEPIPIVTSMNPRSLKGHHIPPDLNTILTDTTYSQVDLNTSMGIQTSTTEKNTNLDQITMFKPGSNVSQMDENYVRVDEEEEDDYDEEDEEGVVKEKMEKMEVNMTLSPSPPPYISSNSILRQRRSRSHSHRHRRRTRGT